MFTADLLNLISKDRFANHANTGEKYIKNIQCAFRNENYAATFQLYMFSKFKFEDSCYD
jgi:hypothetical protein